MFLIISYQLTLISECHHVNIFILFLIMKSINDEAYFGVNPADPFSSLTDEGREKAMDYINLLHASGMYEKQTAKIIPFRSIDIFENAVSAGTGNFLVDGPKETVCIDESILPEDTTFGVRISGDSMEPEFHDGQIAWVLQQESVANGEIGILL